MRAIDQFELDSWWTVMVKSVKIGSYENKIQLFGIIDTGTAFTILGISDYKEFAAQIHQIGGFSCWGAYCYGFASCSNYYDEMPTLTVTF